MYRSPEAQQKRAAWTEHLRYGHVEVSVTDEEDPYVLGTRLRINHD